MTTAITKNNPTDLTAIPTEDLRAELAQALQDSADHLLRLASIWKELERRGEDLTELRKGAAFYLPLIAAGRVDALMVSRFVTKGGLLRAAAALPISEQRRLASGGKVPLCLQSDGHWEEIERDPMSLSGAHLRQVFGPKGIRSAEEQKTHLLDGKARQARVSPAAVIFKPDLHAIQIGKTLVSTRQIGKAIAETVRPAEIQTTKRESLSIPATIIQALRIRATQQGRTVEDVLIQALYAAGIVEY